MENLSLDECISLIRNGKKIEARQSLQKILEQNLQNLNAWYWYIETFDDIEQRLKALRLCLKYNPNDQKIRDAIGVFENKLKSSTIPPRAKSQSIKHPPSNTQGANMNLWIIGGILGIGIVSVICIFAISGLLSKGNKITTLPVLQSGTFNNPVPIGVGYTFPGLGTLTVIKSSWFPGQTGFAIVQIFFSCERPAGQECDTGNFMFDALGGSGNGYSREFDSAIPEPDFGTFINPPVYGGGVEKGYAGFLIKNNESTLMMRVQLLYEDGEFFFTISN